MHERKVRGRKIRTDRETKKRHQEKKELDRLETERNGGGGDTKLEPPDEAVDPFVETEAIADLRERVQRWLGVPRPVHLVGPTGCGKTALALHVATRRDRPVVWINGDATVQTTDLVGEHAGEERYVVRDNFVSNVVKKKSIVRDRWVDNPLSIAVSEGATLVYNEFSRTKPAANNALLSVFEEGVLERPGQRGEDRTIDVHPEFRAILTSNSVEYAGIHEPQDALLDRLIGVHMDFYDFETEAEIVAAHVDLPRERIEDVVSLVRDLREDLDVTVGTRAAIATAEGLAAFPDENGVLVDVSTDVLTSKVASAAEREDLRARIESLA